MKKFSVLFTGVLCIAALFAVTAFKPAANRPSANGQGAILAPYMNGQVQTFAFHANTANNGSVSGTFESHSPGQNIHVHGNITCLTVLPDGKTAAMGGVVTNVNANNPFGVTVGTKIWFRVRDNGEGANAAPDEFSDYYIFEYCGDLNIGMFETVAGNIQVKK